ncbi:MAG: hypothetical protein JWN95_1353 [Frankiales bacterium]|nr:hypothetical protein [Frankiales bacterium]
MSSSENYTARTYDSPRTLLSPGIGPFKLVPSVIGMGGLGLAVIVMMKAGFVYGLALAGVLVLGSVPMLIHRRGRTLYAVWSNALRFARSERRGATRAQTGITGVAAADGRHLTGLLAQLECWSVPSDGWGRPFALVQIPRARQWAVMFEVVPEGGALVDPETKDLKVAAWGQLLALAGRVGGVRQVSVVIESVRDTGALLRAHVAGLIHPAAAPFARDVLLAAGRELSQGVASTLGYVTITFSEAGLGIALKQSLADRARSAAEEIGRRLPELSVQLGLSGAATAIPMSAHAVTRRVKEAFTPDSRLAHAELDIAGDPPQIRWADCGPTAARDGHSDYRHDGAVSVTFEALKVRGGAHSDQVLDRLTRPIREAPLKRVMLMYRPVPESEGGDILDQDVKAAVNRVQRRAGLAHAQDTSALKAARQAAADEADGAGVIDVSLMVTITSPTGDPDEIAKASTAVLRAGRSSRFTLDRIYGGQAAGFAINLGLGRVPADLSLVPELLRDHT